MFLPDAPDGSAGAGAPVSDAQPRFPLGASRDATSRLIPPLPTTSEPDWAKPRRVAFCVGDDAAAVADAWAWTAARFLEPTDDVIMLRVWCPDAAAFRSDVDPDYAAEVDFHQERTTTSWLPPSVRDSLARREASFSGSHSHVVLRDVHANLSPARQIARYCARNAVDVVVLGARPRRGAVARALLGTVSDAVVRNSPCPCLVLRRGGSANVAGVEIAAGPGAVPSADSGSTSPGSPGPPDFGPAGRPSPSPGTFARPTLGTFARPSPGTFARPTPRRVVIAVDGSDASSRAVRWCRDALLRPTDEVILAHAVSGVSERAFDRVYAERGVASRPVGGDDAHAAAATRDAWRALERALERAGTKPPYPSLGDGRSPSRGDESRSRWTRTIRTNGPRGRRPSRGGFLGRGRGASGSRVSGERPLASIGQTSGRGGGETGCVSMWVASEGRRDVGAAAGRSASRRERRRRGSDCRGESRDGGVASRDVAERQHTPRGERAVSVLGVPRTREGGRGGGKGGSASVTREDRFQISGPAVSLKPKTKFHR